MPFEWAQAQKEDPEFRQMRQRLNDRYEDFFVHEQEKKRFEADRRKGKKALEKERLQEEKSREKARQQFVKNRKAKPDQEPLRKAWEAKEQRLAKQYLKDQESYSKKKVRLKKLEEGSKQIPPEVESGLIPEY